MLSLVAAAFAFDVGRVQLAPSTLSGGGTLAQPAPFFDDPGAFYVGGLATLADRPLVFDSGEPVVESAFGVNLGAGVVVARSVRLDATFDLVPSVTFPQHDWSAALEPAALGDTRLGATVGLVAPAGAGVGLALDGHVRLATGSPFFTRGWGGQARLVVGGRHGRFGWNVDAGADAADEPAFLGRQLGNEVLGGAGVHGWLADSIVVGAEVDGRYAIAPVGAVAAASAEWNAYVGYAPYTGAQVTVGGGTALVPGVGTSDARFLLAFGYYGGTRDSRADVSPPPAAPPPVAEPAPPPVPVVPAALTDTTIVPSGPVAFRYRSAWLLPEGEAAVASVAAALLAHPEVRRVAVEAHTGTDGSAAFALQLSQDRADAVRAAIVKAGVAPERVEAHGYGGTRPLVAGADEAAEAANTRVELRVLEREPAAGGPAR